MRTVSLIINARWVVPVIPKDTVYDFYSVIIDGKEIIDCLPTKVIRMPTTLISEEVEGKYTSDTVVDKLHHVVMPGLINMHTHAAMSLFKAFSDDKKLIDWLRLL